MPAEGGLKSQSCCRLQNPRLEAQRRFPLDALTNGLQVGLEHRGIDVFDPLRSAWGRAGIDQRFDPLGSESRQAGPRPKLGTLSQSSPSPQRVALDVTAAPPEDGRPPGSGKP